MPPIVSFMGAVRVSEALRAMEIAKNAANRRENYVKHLRHCVGAFAKHCGDLPIDAVTVEHVESWLSSLGSNPWSRKTYVSRLSALFNFARRRRWIAESPCFYLEKISVDYKCPEVLSVDDSKKLVELCRDHYPKALAWVALALFAGARPEEAGKLEWSDIDFDGRRIIIPPHKSKVRRQRIVTPHEACFRMLELAKERGALLPIACSTRRRYQRKIRDAMGWKRWPKDILRHSCASNWLAVLPDPGRVSRQLGNSVQVLLRHYDALAIPEHAEKFWTL